ncbi:hypothetical protein J3F83DRAFT_698559 [Trichoderma novae-zelandiae]
MAVVRECRRAAIFNLTPNPPAAAHHSGLILLPARFPPIRHARVHLASDLGCREPLSAQANSCARQHGTQSAAPWLRILPTYYLSVLRTILVTLQAEAPKLAYPRHIASLASSPFVNLGSIKPDGLALANFFATPAEAVCDTSLRLWKWLGRTQPWSSAHLEPLQSDLAGAPRLLASAFGGVYTLVRGTALLCRYEYMSCTVSTRGTKAVRLIHRDSNHEAPPGFTSELVELPFGLMLQVLGGWFEISSAKWMTLALLLSKSSPATPAVHPISPSLVVYLWLELARYSCSGSFPGMRTPSYPMLST